jgi:hypothetical protein
MNPISALGTAQPRRQDSRIGWARPRRISRTAHPLRGGRKTGALKDLGPSALHNAATLSSIYYEAHVPGGYF